MSEKPPFTSPPSERNDPPSGETAFVPFPGRTAAGTFLGRSRRFLVSAVLEGRPARVHSNNTGSMLGLLRPGTPMLASFSDNPKRKCPWTQEAVFVEDAATGGFWAGVDTSVPNRMLAAAFRAGALPFARGYSSFRPEVRRGDSRLDGLIQGKGLPDLWIECKNVTLVEDDVAIFPDAATERGRKHLSELMSIVRSGARAAMFYLVQRMDGRCFGPADVVDPEYADLFWRAAAAGVEMRPFRARVDARGVTLQEELPLVRRRA